MNKIKTKVMKTFVSYFLIWGILVQQATQEIPKTLKVYKIAMDQKKDSDIFSYIRLKMPHSTPFPEAFTLCYRCLFAYKDATIRIALPDNNGSFWFGFGLIPEDYRPAYGTVAFMLPTYAGAWYQATEQPHRVHLGHHSWFHICLALDIKRKYFRLYEGGKRARQTDFTKWKIFPSDFLEKKPASLADFILGTSYPYKDDQGHQSFTSVNIFSRVLTDKQMEDITGCITDTPGNYLNWNKADWEIIGNRVDEVNMDFDEVCGQRGKEKVLFPVLMPWNTAERTCQKFGGHLGMIDSEREFKSYIHYFSKNMKIREESCTMHQSVWLSKVNPSMNTTRQLNFLNKYVNGDWEENTNQAIQADFSDKKLYTRKLDRTYCPACFFPRSNYLGMRGGGIRCTREDHGDTKFDRVLKLMADDYGNITILGDYFTKIYFNATAKQWRLEYLRDPTVYATSDALYRTFAAGTHPWKFHNHYCYEDQQEVWITITSCRQGINGEDSGEFTCHDGACIGMEKRCDKVKDCWDNSDEKGCQYIRKDDEYEIDDPPFTPNGVGGINKAVVNISVHLFEILEVGEGGSRFSTKFDLFLSWFDQRLTFQNLKSYKDMNLLRKEERQSLWVPEVMFHNTKSIESTKNDENTFIMINRLGNYTLNDHSENENTLLYKGSENPFIMSRIYNVDFICHYQLDWYPFDQQSCNMSFTMRGIIGKYVELNKDKVVFEGSKSLSLYYVNDYGIVSDDIPAGNINHGKIVSVTVSLKHRLMRNILNVFIPTFLMNLIGHCTNYFEETYFDAVVTLNLTTMLVLTTMFSAVNANLPATSYIKMIDVWLMFNLLIPCFEILLHVYMRTIRDSIATNKREEQQQTETLKSIALTLNIAGNHQSVSQESRQIKNTNKNKRNYLELQLTICHKIGHVCIPIFAMSFVTVYWSIGMYKYYHD